MQFKDEFQKDFWTGYANYWFYEACCEVIGNKFEGVK